jgi:DNA polymerase II large subunit
MLFSDVTSRGEQPQTTLLPQEEHQSRVGVATSEFGKERTKKLYETDVEDHPGMSSEMLQYFLGMEARVSDAYDIANAARTLGLDPKESVEIPLAQDLAARVENLVGPPGIAVRIREMLKEIGNREEVSIMLARELVKEQTGTPEEAIEQAVRTCLAVLTEGVLVAPLEGITKVQLKKNADGTDYTALYFAGPIRSAGGTGQALSVLIADVARRAIGIPDYKAGDKEVERLKEEIPLYRRLQHLQYTPGPREIEIIVKNCPISIDGDGTEKEEISGNRDLPAFDTNRVRGGACLVITEGMSLKAPKILKHVDKLGIDGWEFLRDLIKGKGKGSKGVEPNFKYIKELIAGRPVFSYPSREGGFRLRYGRARTAGTAAIAVHPAALSVTGEFLAIGTQVKIERPGKAGGISTCDTIEGPIVTLKNGNTIRLDTRKEADEVKNLITRIVDLGEILVPFGEFAENNHPLMPGTYSPEWWRVEVAAKGIEGITLRSDDDHPFQTAREAFVFMREHGVPLHPDYTLFWHDLTVEDATDIREFILNHATYDRDSDSMSIKNDPLIKRHLENIGALHTLEEGRICLIQYAYPLIRGLGLDEGLSLVNDPGTHEKEDLRTVSDEEPGPIPEMGAEQNPDTEPKAIDIMTWVSRNSGGVVKPRGPTRIGTRMGRPEKAKERAMKPALHALYPIGTVGTNKRLINLAALEGSVTMEVGVRYCPVCERETHRFRCFCGKRTMDKMAPGNVRMNVREELNYAKKLLSLNQLPEVKGVKGMMSKSKFPEALEKGVLRASREVYVYKDGTMRVDITDMPLTHFRPREIGTTAGRLRELGYQKDIHGNDLTNDDQLLELRVQDVIPAQSVADYLVKVAGFIDDELELIYHMSPYYHVRSRADLVGTLVIGLAPHTSAGVLGRIIGFTKASVCFAHPFFHTAKRRNCDGDEDALLMLMDGLLNFSRDFLPDRLGGLMDAPLVLSTRINPSEIDKEAHNVDLLYEYPIDFYRATERFANPKEIEDIMDTVGGRIGTPGQYEGFGFTHDTSDINDGPEISVYKTLGSMTEKMEEEFKVVSKLRGVDVRDMARRVIESHFLPDIIGNMNSFSKQSIRCVKCNTIYRRIPLKGKCTKLNFEREECPGKLVLTVYENSVKKYLSSTLELAERFKVPLYTVQRIQLMEKSVRSLFDSDRYHKATLDEFF